MDINIKRLYNMTLLFTPCIHSFIFSFSFWFCAPRERAFFFFFFILIFFFFIYKVLALQHLLDYIYIQISRDHTVLLHNFPKCIENPGSHLYAARKVPLYLDIHSFLYCFIAYNLGLLYLKLLTHGGQLSPLTNSLALFS